MNGIQEVSGSIPLASIARLVGALCSSRVLQCNMWSAALKLPESLPRRTPCVSVCEGAQRPSSFGIRRKAHAGIAQLVEHNLAKVGVAGSSPVSRSGQVWGRGWADRLCTKYVELEECVGRLAQLVRAPR